MLSPWPLPPPLVKYTFFYFVSCLLAITVPAIAMQWVFIAMLVLLLSVILHIFYFAAAGTAAYSAAADAGIVSIFVAASVTFHLSSHWHSCIQNCKFAFSLPVVASLPPVDWSFALLEPELTPSTQLSHCHHRQ